MARVVFIASSLCLTGSSLYSEASCVCVCGGGGEGGSDVYVTVGIVCMSECMHVCGCLWDWMCVLNIFNDRCFLYSHIHNQYVNYC